MRRLIFWFIAVAACLLTISPYLHLPYLISDVAESAYFAKRIAHGMVPHSDLFSHHNFGYLFPLVFIEKFRSLTPEALWCVIVLYQLVSATFIYLAVYSIAGKRQAELSALLVVTLGWLIPYNGMVPTIQALIMPGLAGFLYLCVLGVVSKLTHYSYLAAFALGVLLILDQRFLVFTPLLLLTFVVVHRRVKVLSLALTLLILIASPTAYLAWLYAKGAFEDLIYQGLWFPLGVRNSGIEVSLTDRLMGLLSLAFKVDPLIVIFFALALVVVLFCEKRAPVRWYFIVSGLACAIYASLGGRVYANYLTIFMPVAMQTIAILPAYLSSKRLLASSFNCAVLVYALTAMLGGLINYMTIGDWRNQGHVATYSTIVNHVKGQLAEQDELFVWGYAPQIYLYSERFTSFYDIGLLSIAAGNLHDPKMERFGYDSKSLSKLEHYISKTTPKLVVFMETDLLHFYKEKKCNEIPLAAGEGRAHLATFYRLLCEKYAVTAEFRDEGQAILILGRIDG